MGSSLGLRGIDLGVGDMGVFWLAGNPVRLKGELYPALFLCKMARGPSSP